MGQHRTVWELLALGSIAGVIPVYLGIGAAFLVLKLLNRSWEGFLTGISTGILVYLFFDLMHEAVELCRRTGRVDGDLGGPELHQPQPSEEVVRGVAGGDEYAVAFAHASVAETGRRPEYPIEGLGVRVALVPRQDPRAIAGVVDRRPEEQRDGALQRSPQAKVSGGVGPGPAPGGGPEPGAVPGVPAEANSFRCFLRR